MSKRSGRGGRSRELLKDGEDQSPAQAENLDPQPPHGGSAAKEPPKFEDPYKGKTLYEVFNEPD